MVIALMITVTRVFCLELLTLPADIAIGFFLKEIVNWRFS